MQAIAPLWGHATSDSQRSTSTSSKYHLVTRKYGVQSAELPKSTLGLSTPVTFLKIYTMGLESTAGERQPLVPKMSLSHPQTHAPTAYRTYAGCEKILPDSSDRNGSNNCADDEHWVVSHARYSIFKAAIALTIVLSTVWWLSDSQVSAPNSIEATITPPTILPTQHYRRAPTPSLLEVFQIHPPVLTVANNGALQITDDSNNFNSGNYGNNHEVCEKALAVHSFGYSYGQPFIGNYTPPKCKFNRVTWNLTVVSAGRQFDRLGIVYLGNIEVFRTSTAEPTANGIIWTYLKVSCSSQSQILSFN
jgi:hypothetical protein